jgi:lipoprotein signal peptidase
MKINWWLGLFIVVLFGYVGFAFGMAMKVVGLWAAVGIFVCIGLFIFWMWSYGESVSADLKRQKRRARA